MPRERGSELISPWSMWFTDKVLLSWPFTYLNRAGPCQILPGNMSSQTDRQTDKQTINNHSYRNNNTMNSSIELGTSAEYQNWFTISLVHCSKLFLPFSWLAYLKWNEKAHASQIGWWWTRIREEKHFLKFWISQKTLF